MPLIPKNAVGAKDTREKYFSGLAFIYNIQFEDLFY